MAHAVKPRVTMTPDEVWEKLYKEVMKLEEGLKEAVTRAIRTGTGADRDKELALKILEHFRGDHDQAIQSLRTPAASGPASNTN